MEWGGVDPERLNQSGGGGRAGKRGRVFRWWTEGEVSSLVFIGVHPFQRKWSPESSCEPPSSLQRSHIPTVPLKTGQVPRTRQAINDQIGCSLPQFCFLLFASGAYCVVQAGPKLDGLPRLAF